VLDQTVAEDYFTAMEQVEQQLELVPSGNEDHKKKDEIVKVQLSAQILAWAERLTLPELCQRERLEIAESLKRALSLNSTSQLSPPLACAS
jgi:hypothetical protein